MLGVGLAAPVDRHQPGIGAPGAGAVAVAAALRSDGAAAMKPSARAAAAKPIGAVTVTLEP